MISILNPVFILSSSGAWFKFKDKYKKFESITGESYAWASATDQRIWVAQPLQFSQSLWRALHSVPLYKQSKFHAILEISFIDSFVNLSKIVNNICPGEPLSRPLPRQYNSEQWLHKLLWMSKSGCKIPPYQITTPRALETLWNIDSNVVQSGMFETVYDRT